MTELQLEFIRKFGRKELTEGCKVYCGWWHLGQGDTRYIDTILRECNQGNYIDYETLKSDKNVISAIGKEGRYNHGEILEILGHPVQWHDVFAKLKEMGISCVISIEQSGDEKEIIDMFFSLSKRGSIKIECDLCLSPMEQPELIEQLLLLIK